MIIKCEEKNIPMARKMATRVLTFKFRMGIETNGQGQQGKLFSVARWTQAIFRMGRSSVCVKADAPAIVSYVLVTKKPVQRNWQCQVLPDVRSLASDGES